jgi:abhydrolase domain-containing protein 5
MVFVFLLCRTRYVQEQVNIGSGPPGSKITWFRSTSNEPRFINTVTFDTKESNSPTLVMVHGYGASQGFFYRNFDALSHRFRVVAIDQLGLVSFSGLRFQLYPTFHYFLYLLACVYM